MKLLKKILLGLVAVVILLLVVIAFTNNEYTVKREITINQSKQDVFNYVRLMKNQDNYSNWFMADPGMKKDYKNTDGEVGFVYAWESSKDEVGKGEQEITKLTNGQRIEAEIRFEKPFEGISDTFMTTEALSPDQTKVTWGFHTKMPYPLNGMLLIMDVEKILGDQMQGSLNNLKNVLEK